MLSIDPRDPAVTYAGVLDALPIVTFLAHAEGRISYLSPSWTRLTGIDTNRLLEEGFVSVLHPDDAAHAAHGWERSLAHVHAHHDEFRLHLRDGSYRWMTCRIDPLRADGRVVGWFGTLHDVDARKRAEAGLAHSVSTYRALAATIPGVTWTASAAGDLTFVGDRWASLHGRPREAALGASWLESVYPPDRERVQATWARSLATGDAYDVQFRLRVADGTYRWFLVRALPIRDEWGHIAQWVGVNVDIEDQHRADESREQFVRLIERSDDFIAISDGNGMPTYVNEAGRRLLDVDSVERARGRHLIDYFVPEERPFVADVVLHAVRHEGRWLGELHLQNFQTGEAVPISYDAFSLVNDAGGLAGFAMVGRDLRGRQRIEAGLRVLAYTGDVMFRSLDFSQTLRNVAEAVTREFATYCMVDMFAPDGTLESIASAHANPRLAPVLERAVRTRLMGDDHYAMRAARYGQSTIVEHVGADWTRTINALPEDDLEALDPRSIMCVPIRARFDGERMGALTFVVDARHARGGYRADDLAFAEEVGLRAGIAFNHARAFERERQIAATLQQASLPAGLPAVEGLQLSVDYRPGSSEATIGGDWYDAFALDDGRVAFTIGDVMGNGLAAAVTMGKLRQVMQSTALVLGDLHLMLVAADRTVRSISCETYATALAAIYDPARREFTIASAGHPAPLLLHADGRIEELQSPGTMLGLRTAERTATLTVAAPAGSTLVLYTDGLVESTRDAGGSERRLHAALRDRATLSHPRPARAIIERVLAGKPPSDDIAVLVATVAN